MRLYWARVLRATTCVAPGTLHNQDYCFHVQIITRDMRMLSYQAMTLPDLYQKIKDAGHQVWGYKDYLDYAWPRNALEYLMVREIMKARGESEAEIDAQLWTYNQKGGE